MGGGAVSKTQSQQPGLRRFSSATQAVRSHVGSGSVPASAEDKLLACFQRWDITGSGTISVYALMRVLQKCGVELEPKDVSNVFSTIDVNQDGVIDYDEFVAWLYPGHKVPYGKTDLPLASSVDPSSADSGSMRLLLLFHSVKNLPKSCSSASASAFVAEGDRAIGSKASWPSILDCNDPCWNVTRDLGSHMCGPAAESSAALHLEIWENRTMVGDVVLPVTDIQRNCWYEKPLDLTASFLKKSLGQLSPCVRFMISKEPPLVKKVFLVRHGESAWNKAQREKKVSAMLEQVDHPLSDDGIQQCMKLQERIAAVKAEGPKSQNERQFLQAQVVLSSPLSRAIQTALVGLHPILLQTGSLHLCRNAREKRNLGGRDTTGKARGEAEIAARLHTELAKGGVQESDIDRFLAIPLNSKEACDKWWNDSRESASSVGERLQEFVSQLRFLKEERIVVVGHSHFFRNLLQQGLNSAAIVAGASTADVLSKKLENCSVMAITLDFRIPGEKPITEVELLLGTTMC